MDRFTVSTEEKYVAVAMHDTKRTMKQPPPTCLAAAVLRSPKTLGAIQQKSIDRLSLRKSRFACSTYGAVNNNIGPLRSR